MLEYKINIMKALKDAGYSSSRMRQEKIFGERTIQLMRHNEVVGIIAIERLCGLLQMQPGDIICYREDKADEEEKQEVR